MEKANVATGTVKWFNANKGYGFIQPQDGSNDVFVHISAVERAGLTTLREGQQIEYELVQGRNGKSSAENLKASYLGGGFLEEANVATGIVKWFNVNKGYGFIQPPDGSNDVFVHISAVERAGLSTLNEGQRIGYELVTGRNGKSSAENLRIK